VPDAVPSLRSRATDLLRAIGQLGNLSNGIATIAAAVGIAIGWVGKLEWPLVLALALLLVGLGQIGSGIVLRRLQGEPRLPPATLAPIPGVGPNVIGLGGGEEPVHTAPKIKVLFANAREGADADCEEPHFDCGKLLIANQGLGARVSIAVRVDGNARRLFLLRDGASEREFMLHNGDQIRVPLFVRTRQEARWTRAWTPGLVMQRATAELPPGSLVILDESFQATPAAPTVIPPGRHRLDVDVLTVGHPQVTESFHIFVPTDPQKSIWFDRVDD
jgi:hypothetical protein